MKNIFFVYLDHAVDLYMYKHISRLGNFIKPVLIWCLVKLGVFLYQDYIFHFYFYYFIYCFIIFFSFSLFHFYFFKYFFILVSRLLHESSISSSNSINSSLRFDRTLKKLKLVTVSAQVPGNMRNVFRPCHIIFALESDNKTQTVPDIQYSH